jgi:hypothetical protein
MKIGGITKLLNYRSNIKETCIVVQPCEVNENIHPTIVMQQEQQYRDCVEEENVVDISSEDGRRNRKQYVDENKRQDYINVHILKITVSNKLQPKEFCPI